MIHDGVYVDASWRPREATKARIAVVLVRGGRVVESHLKRESHRTSMNAERAAVAWGKRLFPGLPVYTDCRNIVAETGAAWVPRRCNTAADAVSRGEKRPRVRRTGRGCVRAIRPGRMIF